MLEPIIKYIPCIIMNDGTIYGFKYTTTDDGFISVSLVSPAENTPHAVFFPNTDAWKALRDWMDTWLSQHTCKEMKYVRVVEEV